MSKGIRFPLAVMIALLLALGAFFISSPAHAATKGIQASNFGCAQNLVANTQILGGFEYTITSNGPYHVLIQDHGLNLDRSFDVFEYLLQDTSNGGEFVLQGKYVHYLQSSGVIQVIGTNVEMSISYDAVNMFVCGGGWSTPTFLYYPHALIPGKPVQ